LRAAWLAAALAVLALAGCKAETSTLSGEAIVSGIPWPAGEEARYRLLDGDEEKGSGVLTIDSQGGRVTFRQEFESADFRDEVVAVADAATMEPQSIERVIDGPEGERRWEVRYEGAAATIVQKSAEDEREDKVSVPTSSYDSWTDVFLWRTIDFRDGYESSYSDVLAATLAKPQVISQTLRVRGKETVEVPAGRFEAWRLEISSDEGSQQAWYANTAERPLVRYDNGSLVFELVSLSSPAGQGAGEGDAVGTAWKGGEGRGSALPPTSAINSKKTTNAARSTRTGQSTRSWSMRRIADTERPCLAAFGGYNS